MDCWSHHLTWKYLSLSKSVFSPACAGSASPLDNFKEQKRCPQSGLCCLAWLTPLFCAQAQEPARGPRTRGGHKRSHSYGRLKPMGDTKGSPSYL